MAVSCNQQHQIPGRQTPPWNVLLISGGSGIGKSSVARHVARYYGCALGEVDDFRLVLQRVTTPAQQPALHALLEPSIWYASPEMLVQRMITVAQIISDALEIVIANHIATNAPIVLEGDGILPQLATQRFFANRTVKPGEVRGLCLYEPEKAQLWRNITTRGRGFEQQSHDVQQNQVQLAWLYGQWLKQEAEEYHVPVLTARPWDDVVARVLATDWAAYE